MYHHSWVYEKTTCAFFHAVLIDNIASGEALFSAVFFSILGDMPSHAHAATLQTPILEDTLPNCCVWYLHILSLHCTYA